MRQYAVRSSSGRSQGFTRHFQYFRVNKNLYLQPTYINISFIEITIEMAARKVLNTIILGAPGGGKGTISKKLVKKYNFAHVSTGDLLRAHVQDPNSELGKKAKELMASGALVPDELVLDMLHTEVNKLDNPRVLLDGFPRTLSQAEALQTFMPLNAVIVLDIPHETIIDRISNRMIHLSSGRIYNQTYNPEKNKGFDDVTGEELVQREDDKPDTVKARLVAYEETTAPLIDYYQQQQTNDNELLVSRFAGTESDVIFPDIVQWMQNMKLVPTNE